MKEIIIKCPSCGAQYYPAELFYRDDLLGYPKEIEKTTLGEIIYSEGSLPEYTTTYICDKCNTKFKVTADINYSTSIMKTQLDDYIVKHEQKITLEETDGE